MREDRWHKNPASRIIQNQISNLPGSIYVVQAATSSESNVSEPFGCGQVLDVARCGGGDIDRGLDELYGMGVRSMFLCHKFDNGLCGVRFDEGATGTAINAGQFLSTGTFWETERCLGPQVDNPIAPSGNAHSTVHARVRAVHFGGGADGRDTELAWCWVWLWDRHEWAWGLASTAER